MSDETVTLEEVQAPEPNISLLNVAIIGSSFGRRMDLVNKVWDKIKDATRDEIDVMASLVDAPPQVSQRPSVDLDVRERVLMWNENQSSRELFERMLEAGVSRGVNFCPFTAYAYFVKRIMLNHEMSMELEKHKPILVEGQAPKYSNSVLQNMAVENNNVTAGIMSLQNVMGEMYDGFWSYGFVLDSDEPPAVAMETLNGVALPMGSEEQLRHYYTMKLVEMNKMPFLRLPADIDEAAQVMFLTLCAGLEIKTEEEKDVS
jgi:hypothetical protein